jgi:hypothetical protein
LDRLNGFFGAWSEAVILEKANKTHVSRMGSDDFVVPSRCGFSARISLPRGVLSGLTAMKLENLVT